MSEANNFEILYGGVDLTITVIEDGKRKVETVKVSKAPFRKLQDLGQVMIQGNDAAEVAFYVSRPIEWVDTVLQEDALAILKEGRRLNAKVFQEWLGTRQEWVKLLGVESANPTKAESSISPKLSNS